MPSIVTNPQPRYLRTGFLPFDVVQVSAQDVQEQNIVVDLAELSALPSTMPSGSTLLVLSLDDEFVLRRESTLPPDSMVIIPAVGGGNWERRFRPSMKWAHQVIWEYNSVTGDDENDGSTNVVGANHVGPVKTTDEICRRLSRVKLPAFNYFSYVVNLNSAVPSTDRVVFSALTNPGGTGSTGDIFDTLTFVDNQPPVVLFSGAFTAVTAGVSGPGGGTRASFNGGVGFVAANFIGKRVLVTSGAASGSRTWIGKSLGGQVAQVGDFVDPLGLPAIGDTFEILEFPIFEAQIKFCDASSGEIILVGLDLQTHDIVNRAGAVTLIGCHVGVLAFCDFGGAVVNIFECCVESPIGTIFNPVGRMQIASSVILSGCQNIETSEMEISESTFVGGVVGQADLSFDLHEPAGLTLRFSKFNAGSSGVAIWDAPNIAGSSGALSIGRCGVAFVASPLYGASPAALVGVFAEGGGVVMIRDDVLPTITGGGANIRMDANAVIPTISAITGLPVAGAPVTSWTGAGGWSDAATYNRNAHNLRNGTRIITCA